MGPVIDEPENQDEGLRMQFYDDNKVDFMKLNYDPRTEIYEERKELLKKAFS